MKQTAEEFAEDVLNTVARRGPVYKFIARKIKARDIEVLEEAAKIRCLECDEEGFALRDTEKAEWMHTGQRYCGSARIHDRIAELKKEQPMEFETVPIPLTTRDGKASSMYNSLLVALRKGRESDSAVSVAVPDGVETYNHREKVRGSLRVLLEPNEKLRTSTDNAARKVTYWIERVEANAE